MLDLEGPKRLQQYTNSGNDVVLKKNVEGIIYMLKEHHAFSIVYAHYLL